MQAIILAAGKGTRFKELTQDKPKCMMKLNNETLIQRLLRQLDRIKLDKIIIIAGYKADVLKDYIAKLNITTSIEIVVNDDYDNSNNIVTVQRAGAYLIADDTLMFESDLVLADDVIPELAKNKATNYAVVSPFQPWMDGTCVCSDDSGFITEFLPKEGIAQYSEDSLLKTVNIYRLSKEFSKYKFLPYLNAQIEGFGGNSYYETVLGTLVAINSDLLRGVVISPDKWYETDDTQDLSIAQIKFCSDPIEKMKAMESRYGGYWRFPSVHDYAYLVNPFFPPQKMIDDFHKNLQHLIIDYPSGLTVNSALAGKYYNIEDSQIVVGNGAAELIKVVLEQSQGKVGVIRPTFEEYPNRLAVERVVCMDTEDRGYKYNAQDIIEYFDDKHLSIIIIINPDNPSGNYLSHHDMMLLCDWSMAKGIQLIIDESFSDFANAESVTSVLKQDVLNSYKNLIVIKSISKSFGVPGVRLGILATANKKLVSSIKQKVSIWNINSFGEYFLQIIEKYKSDYFDALNKFYSVRDKLENNLLQIDYLKVLPSQANYFMIELLHDVTAIELCGYLLNNHSILIKDLTAKKGINKQYIRIAVKTEKENDELIRALEDYKIDKGI